MSIADKIRNHARKRYVLPALRRGKKRFSIHVGENVRDLKLAGRVPAVCSALKTGKFLKENNLRVVETVAPKSGQSTTVVYTYEFLDIKAGSETEDDPWLRLRGTFKDIFSQSGDGEAYLRDERRSFHSREDSK